MNYGMILLILVSFLMGCTHLKRSNEYNQENLSQRSYLNPQDQRLYEESEYELGMNQLSRSLSESEYAALQKRVLVKNLESRLESSLEKNLYYKNKPFFRNDSERIQFLSVEDFSDKMKWLDDNNFLSRVSSYSSDEESAIEQNDVLLHMSMKAVQESWGEPDTKEISGNELHGNQKWHYKAYLSSQDGYNEQNRIVYFENGRVIAWKTQ